MLVTRVAPTPSGYLHPGNAVNILLTSWLARSGRGRLLLRIDDFDTGRARPEYLADVFDVLAWLGVVPDDGPTSPAQFESGWAMARRTDRFRAALDALRQRHPGRVFTCRCSRRQLSADGRCVAGCPDAGLTLRPDITCVRLRVPRGVTADLGSHRHGVPPGDHVLWRRDDLPAYQLGSVVADLDLGVTAIVRGLDLLDSSALQRHLAELLGEPRFASITIHHHGLVPGAGGTKLSKSAGAQAHPMPRTDQLRAALTRTAVALGEPLGIAPPG